jgi:hypothetical protein
MPPELAEFLPALQLAAHTALHFHPDRQCGLPFVPVGTPQLKKALTTMHGVSITASAVLGNLPG